MSRAKKDRSLGSVRDRLSSMSMSSSDSDVETAPKNSTESEKRKKEVASQRSTLSQGTPQLKSASRTSNVPQQTRKKTPEKHQVNPPEKSEENLQLKAESQSQLQLQPSAAQKKKSSADVRKSSADVPEAATPKPRPFRSSSSSGGLGGKPSVVLPPSPRTTTPTPTPAPHLPSPAPSASPVHPASPARVSLQIPDDASSSRRSSTLPRAPRRRRSEDVNIVIPPPIPEFRQSISLPEEEEVPAATPTRRFSLLSRQARRSSSASAPRESQSGSRRASLSERIRSLTRAHSPPGRERMPLRDPHTVTPFTAPAPHPSGGFLQPREAVMGCGEPARRRSSIMEAHYGLDQPVSFGNMLFTALITLVVITTYGFQLDLPEALNRLTDHSAVTRKLRFHQSGICPDRGSSLVEKDGPFVWDAAKHRLFLWSFHLGYMASGVPGAVLAEKYTAKWVIVFGLSLMLIASMFIPIVVVFKESVQPDVFAFLMLLEGLGGGVILPAVTTLLSKWTTRRHRSVYAGVVYGGIALGPVVSALVGEIAGMLPWNFVYHFVVLGLIPWLLVVAFWLEDDTGHLDRCMPVRDHMMILAEQANVRSYDKNISFPFQDVGKSVAFWALMTMHFFGNSTFYALTFLVPIYMKQVLRYNPHEYLALRIVPYLAMFFVSITAGLTIDVARHHGVISTTGGRRYASLVAVLFPAITLISMTFIECNTSIASGVYLIGICTLGAQSVGWLTNHLDLAPNFAGPLMAITNSVATVPYLLWPFLVATITEGSAGTELRDRWSMTFQGVAGLHFLSFIFYALSGTGAIQDWNMYKG